MVLLAVAAALATRLTMVVNLVVCLVVFVLGHLARRRCFHGQRRVIQVNWVTDAQVVAREQARHRVSAFFKRLVSPGARADAAAH